MTSILEMNLSARLGTTANMGDLDVPSIRDALILGNLALIQVQATVISFSDSRSSSAALSRRKKKVVTKEDRAVSGLGTVMSEHERLLYRVKTGRYLSCDFFFFFSVYISTLSPTYRRYAFEPRSLSIKILFVYSLVTPVVRGEMSLVFSSDRCGRPAFAKSP